jgi:hypothetical protein
MREASLSAAEIAHRSGNATRGKERQRADRNQPQQ